jgi:hypothetical protein
MVIDAINSLSALKMNLLDLSTAQSIQQRRLQELSQSFSEKALCHPALFDGCVGAIDGWLCTIRVPSKKAVAGTAQLYYSGHYYTYGINVQAMCDGDSKFTAISISSPGGTNDIVAYQRAKFAHKFVDKLPREFVVVAGNATCNLARVAQVAHSALHFTCWWHVGQCKSLIMSTASYQANTVPLSTSTKPVEVSLVNSTFLLETAGLAMQFRDGH